MIGSKLSINAVKLFGGIFDYPSRKLRLEEVELELAEPDVWDNQDKAQSLSRELSVLKSSVSVFDELEVALVDASELSEIAFDENDSDALDEIYSELGALEEKLAELEFRRMFDQEMDAANAFVEVQSGSGGTDVSF